ncbi:unnamed protein product [Closterium sp. NIES-54]
MKRSEEKRAKSPKPSKKKAKTDSPSVKSSKKPKTSATAADGAAKSSLRADDDTWKQRASTDKDHADRSGGSDGDAADGAEPAAGSAAAGAAGAAGGGEAGTGGAYEEEMTGLVLRNEEFEDGNTGGSGSGGVRCLHEVAYPKGWKLPTSKEAARKPLPEKPAKEYPFKLDPFQEEAVRCLEANESVLIAVDVETYVASFRPDIMEAVFGWCHGAAFADVLAAADTFEGSLIRAMRRLEELLQELSRRPALSVASPCSSSHRPAARAPHCWQPRRPALPARCPALPALSRPAARRPAARAALLLPALLHAALLAGALLPARHPVGSRTALPCPRAALLAAALPCPGRAPLFPSRAPPLPALRASLVLARRPACVLPCCLSPATADSATRSQWLTRDAAARLAIRNHLPLAEHGHFGQHKTAKSLYDAVVARYSSPAAAALGRLILPYLFPELSAFAIVEDLVTHLRTSDTRYCAALPTEFLDRNPPPPPINITLYFIVTRLPDSLRAVRDHFLALDPTYLTVDLLEKHLLAAETSVVADVGTASALSGKRRSSKGKGGKRGGGGSGGSGSGGSEAVEVAEVVAAVGVVAGVGASVVAVVAAVGVGVAVVAAVGVVEAEVLAVGVELLRRVVVARGSSISVGARPLRLSSFVRGLLSVGRLGHHCFSRLDDAWRAEFGDEAERPRWLELLRSGVDIYALDYDAILAAMYALSVSAGGDCYLCVPPDPGIEAATLGASESALPGTAHAEALHTFTLDSGASRCFFRDNTILTLLPAPVLVRLADPSGGPVLARSSTVLPCPAVSASGPVAAPCSCCLLSHQTLLWHHRLGHPSLPRLRGMHSRLLVSGLPRSLPPLPPSPAPPCVPCIEGRQRAASHSSSFPTMTGPLQNLHMDMWGPARVSGQDRERYFLLVVDDYTRYTTVFPLRSKGEIPDVLIPWIRAFRLQLHERFRQDLRVLRLHSDRGGEFSFDLLRDFCRGEGILQPFTLPASPQQNGVAECCVGLVMEVARTSMIHAAAPHFLWPFAVRYASHQLNLWPRVSLPETSPTLRWTGKVGDASVFRVWGSRAFVRDTSADKLSVRAIPCVFLGFVPDAPGWQFYHPTSHRVLPSQGVTFDKSVPFYRLFPYRTAPLPPPPAALPRSRSPSDPLPMAVPAKVAVDSGAAIGAASRGAASGVAVSGGAASGGAEPASAEPRGAKREGAEPGGAESEGAESRGAELEGAEPGDTEPEGAEPGVAESEGAESGGAEPRGIASAGGAGGSATGGNGAGGAGATSLGGAGAAGPGRAHTSGAGAAGAGGVGGAGAGDPGAGGTSAGGTGAGGDGVGGAGAGDPGAGGSGAGAGGARAGGTRAGGVGAGGTGGGGARAGGTRAGDPGTRGAGVGGAGFGGTGAGGAVQRQPFFVPPPPSSLPPPDSVLCQLESPLPAPSPYAEHTGSLTERREPKSRPASPVRAVRTGRRVSRPRPPLVLDTHIMALRPSSVPLRVPLPSPPASSLPDIPDPEFDLARAACPTVSRLLATVVTDRLFESTVASALVAELVDFAAACRLDYPASLVAKSKSDCPPSVGGECALGTEVLEDRKEDFECLAAAVSHLVAMLLAPEGDPDAPDIPTPCSYAEAITVPYSSQWQAAMDAEMASLKSIRTYVDAVPPPGTNIVDGMWIFRVKRPLGSSTVFKARYVSRGYSQRQGVDFFHTFSPTPKMTTLWVLLHVAAQRDYELHSLDISTTFLKGSLHEVIWLRCPPGFTGSFLAGTLWSLRWAVYGLRQVPYEWHNTLRMMLAALGFAPLTADPSLFLHTDTSLPPFYIPVYVDNLVFATADTEALALVKSELQKRHTCTDMGVLHSYLGLQITRDRARRTITLTQSHMVHQIL